MTYVPEHMDPGPAGNLIIALHTYGLEDQFFYHTKQYHKAGKARKRDLPGSNYFPNIKTFLENHFQMGELYLEYVKGGRVNVH